ncbi:MAG: SusC/RagA family TonB-linked outer membrane protein [Flavobacterium sp.]|nr:SusC/RagA family TonB-linked outer membrane protein [Flavobacterium sp.]
MNLKKLVKSIFYACFLLFSTAALAQTKVVTGKVTDAKDGSAVPNVSVLVKGTKQGTQTAADGTFKLTVAQNATTLTISSIGFATQEVSIVGKSSVDVALKAAASDQLEDIVVIGYGTARKKDLTGATATVSEKNFNKGIFTAPDQLIQGKVAGVQVIANGGQPGSANTIKIRGNSAVTGTGAPLYVIDGVALDGRSARPGLNAQNLGNTPAGNPLNFLNPSDIASMDVLKDAAATAIYGSRAAYGVVLITTKRGQSGQPKIDFGGSAGVSSIAKKIKVLNADQFKQALTYYGVSSTNNYGGNVDALDAILRSATTQSYNAAFSAGTENAKYRLSTSVLDQQGIVRKNDFKKYSASLSANFKMLDSKKLGLDFNIITSQYIENNAPVTNNAGAAGSLIGQALQWNPTLALKIGDSLVNVGGNSIINPLGMSEAYNDNSKVTSVLASLSPYYKFNSWLEYRMLYSINYSTGIRRASIQQKINLADVVGKGWASVGNSELITSQITHTLNFNKAVAKDLNLNAVVGYEYLKYQNKGSSQSGFGPAGGGFGNYGLDYTNYLQFSDPGSRGISSYIDPSSEIQSFFARAIFSYKGKYTLSATMRADGSSKFGVNNRYGYFPSISGAWNVSKENFFKSNLINDLRVRASWGKTGNQEFPAGSAQAKYSFTGPGAVNQVNNPNPDLKWQSDVQYNFGIDFSILKNKIFGSIEYFNKTTTDLLYPTIPIQPAPPGSVATWKNLDGQVINKGFEVSLNAAIIRSNDFNWDFGINASFIDNKVQNLSAIIPTGELSGQGITGTYSQTIRNGAPINSFFTKHFEGFDKATGLAIYTEDGYTRYLLGNPNPTTILGITTSVSYKKLTATLNFNGSFGQKIYNNTLNNVINVGSINGGRNIALSVFQDPIKESFANPVTASDRFIENGGYLKLANLTLNYNLGAVGKVFKAANVYVNGQNLLIFTKFTGFDPEVNVDKNVNGVPSVGIEYTPYPSARTFTFGVNFSL